MVPNEFAARTPMDRNIERGYRTGAKPLIEPRSGQGEAPTSGCTPATFSIASRAGKPATATSKSATATRRPR